MRILGIESSCDETAAAVVQDGRQVLSNVIATSLEEHKLYGGVVPEIASRRHAESISGVVRQALADGKHLLLPRVLSKTAMDWVEIPDLALLGPGAFGILEPPADLPAADPAAFARPLALIPCLAAGRDGVRLGRGGGYYDRFWHTIKGQSYCSAPKRC